MLSVLHFADAHIDMANYGRHDPETGLPMRVMDFLKSLDTIVEAAITEKVDLVIFAGDAYKDRNPAPTFQREWGVRMMRLSRAGIPTLLLVGNHDLSPALGRAHALEEFATLDVPHVRVLDKPCFLTPDDLEGLSLQVIALPWISRSGLMAHLDIRASDPAQIYQELEVRLTELVGEWLERADPEIPTVLTAHASVQGAKYGGERTVMLGADLVLPGSLVKDPRLDYVALGHIHKPQDLNRKAPVRAGRTGPSVARRACRARDGHPPVVYPGSIERVDFGEVADDKFYVIAHIDKGSTDVEWRQLEDIRPFVDRFVDLPALATQGDESIDSQEGISQRLREALPPLDQLEGAIVRLVIEYPRDWEPLIDESALREYAAGAFEFHLVKRPQMETRIRLPEDQTVGSLSPLELLELYWRAAHTDPEEIEALSELAAEIIKGDDH